MMFIAALGACLAFFAQPAAAGKWCKGDHYHYGSGTGRTEEKAEAAAIRAWRDFTAFEYGSAWADFWDAKNERVKCRRTDSGYSCHAEGIPCRYR